MLDSLIRQEINVNGPLSQSRFMELALQHPTYGYYCSRESVGQDFTTSPEISQVFGELIGAWAIDYYQRLQHPKTVSLVELGPGKGTLMADFLRMTKASKSFSKAINLTLVEMNPLLQATQLKAIPFPTTWVKRFQDVPIQSAPLIIIANEFIDTLPTNYYIRKDNVLYEKRVDVQDGKLAFIQALIHECQGINKTWEESPVAKTLVNEICTRLLKQSGIFLCIDYGYNRGEGESLQALYGGAPSDPLSHIGRSDLTCHVNFGQLKEIALSRGLGTLGPISQRQFLKNIGIDMRLDMLKHENPSQKANLEIAKTRLIHPQQMGTLFKVMAIFSPLSVTPAGFEQ